MSHCIVSWNTSSRSLHDRRPLIPAGLLSAKARIDMTVRSTRRPLFATSQFDRGAILSAAASAARARQERYSCTWAEAMSVCLTAAWSAAKMACHIAAN